MWTPIGEICWFYGVFDGNGHTVSGVYINNEKNCQGLFGECNGTIKNVGVLDSYIHGSGNVGGVVGYGSAVTNCYSTGTVSGSSYVGGVVGYGSAVTNCYSTGTVSGSSYVGGVVGDGSTVKSCYSTGTVSGSSYVGGVVGDGSTVKSCYSTGTVSGDNYVGGVVGYSYETVEDCYNVGTVSGDYDIGGVVGRGSEVTGCYYLAGCGVELNAHGQPLDKEQLSNKDSFENWNFNKTWEIGYRDDYDFPTLKCFGSKQYLYRIVFADGENILSDELRSNTDTFTVSALSHSEYDFAYYEDENGNKYYDGDTIAFGDDMTYRVAWAVRNKSDDVWDGTYDTEWDGSGTEDAPYLITSAGELAGLSVKVNGGESYRDTFFKLTTDIRLNDGGGKFDYYLTGKNVWTPIGGDSVFRGVFDGDGHTVSGVYINNRENHQGLFGHSFGTIKNLGVVDSFVSGNDYVGGVVGEISNAMIVDCYNTGTVSGRDRVGGVAGYGWSATIIMDCHNTGAVSGNDYVGGVVGDGNEVTNCYNAGAVSGNEYVGGVVGGGNEVTNCYNTGTISGRDRVGGVVGNAHQAVKNCCNTGTVGGDGFVGGAVGSGSATDCSNTGAISGNITVGGVVGSGSATDCYNDGDVTGRGNVGGVVGEGFSKTVVNCYNVGKVSGNGDCVGGIIGYGFSSTVTDCYYLAGCGADLNEYGCPLSSAQLSDKASFENWNFNNTWEIGYRDDYNYPTLRCFGSKIYFNRIVFADGENILSDELRSNTDTFTVSALSHSEYDFAYYEDENGNRYYEGDAIAFDKDMTYTVAWTVRNTSKNVWDGTYDTEWDGSGTEDDPYLITSAGELAGLSVKVNGGEGYWDTFFKLTTDIKLNDGGDKFDYYLTGKNVWTPIGSDVVFYGVFDGDGHTVSGVYINNRENCQGLFGRSNGTIKNLRMTDSYVSGSGEYSYVGGVVGNGSAVTSCSNAGTVSGSGEYSHVGGVVGYGTTVTNCSNAGTVSGSGEYSYVGGMVGYGTTVTNCRNTGTVRDSGADGNVGGVVGGGNEVTDCYNTGTISGSGADGNVGGIVGYASYTVTDCYNTGTISGSGADGFVGGVAGRGSATDCYNTGAISGSGGFVGGITGDGSTVTYCYNTGTVSGGGTHGSVGGIAGRGSTVTYCYNLSAVSGNDGSFSNNIGGIVGNGSPVVTNCYNAGSVSNGYDVGGISGGYGSTITNCYNAGTVSGIDKSSHVGGIIAGNGTVENGYYLTDCVTDIDISKYGIALTESQMRQKESFAGFDFDAVWTIDGSAGYPYPTLIDVRHEAKIFTVTFTDDIGNVISEQEIEDGEAATAPDMSGYLRSEGDYVYTFDHWEGDYGSVRLILR